MLQAKIYVSMLGTLSITWNGQSITEKDSRSRKTWLLLAYLIHERSRHIKQQEIIRLLWDEKEEQTNPQGSLKTALHRLRSMLNKLNESAGHQLILRQDSSYAWNPQYELEYDVEIFETLYRETIAAQEDDIRLAHCLQAVRLYQGDFLPLLSQEPWVQQISAKYHAMYLELVKTAVSILESRGQIRDVVEICQQALKIEPFDEDLFESLLRGLLETDQCEAAAEAYEQLNSQLLATFGTMPSENIRNLYWKALRTDNGYIVPVDEICRQLKETEEAPGALFCEYDFFKVLYQAQARAIARTGEAYHIGLLSVKARAGKNLSQSSLDIVMKNLQETDLLKCTPR